MFQGLRIRLTLWFVLLSGLAYVLFVFGSTFLFHNALTRALDDELHALLAEAAPIIMVAREDDQMKARFSGLFSTAGGYKSAGQIFDANANLVRENGAKGVPIFHARTLEVRGPQGVLRSMSLPLRENGKTVGFLQIQVPTEQRDLSIEKFIFTNIILCPIFLFSLALAGYMVSGKAVKPVQESYQVLKMFVQDAGHELKTPVATIQITAENLAEDLKDAEMQERLGVITRNTERMTKLVTDMLTLAKMEVATSTVRLEKVDVCQLLEQLREEFTPRFAQANKKFETNFQAVPKVMGDAESLLRLFSNLIENALKYTEEGNSVTVNLKAKDNKIEVAIIDTGIGIPKDGIPRLFDRFYRVDRSRARVRGGSGLGLSIVKAIAELHGGTLNVVSAEGKGSTFTVSIPTV